MYLRSVVVCSGYVALKLNVSSIFGKNNEARVLHLLNDSTYDQQPGYRNIIRLLDSFSIEGPNGRHDCLVTEIVGTMHEVTSQVMFEFGCKDMSIQAMAGLSYIHNRGVAHAGV